MSRKNTQAMSSIKRLCRIQNFDESVIQRRSKLILSCYRDTCWSTAARADEVHEDLVCYCGSDLDTALIYLETFAPDEMRERFEEKIRSLFETKWIIELVESAMLQVREFPVKGELYFSLLSKCYLTRFSYSESELLEVLKLERSSFYDRKKEAICVFGLALWGNALPKLQQFLHGAQAEMDDSTWLYSDESDF